MGGVRRSPEFVQELLPRPYKGSNVVGFAGKASKLFPLYLIVLVDGQGLREEVFQERALGRRRDRQLLHVGADVVANPRHGGAKLAFQGGRVGVQAPPNQHC